MAVVMRASNSSLIHGGVFRKTILGGASGTPSDSSANLRARQIPTTSRAPSTSEKVTCTHHGGRRRGPAGDALPEPADLPPASARLGDSTSDDFTRLARAMYRPLSNR